MLSVELEASRELGVLAVVKGQKMWEDGKAHLVSRQPLTRHTGKIHCISGHGSWHCQS